MKKSINISVDANSFPNKSIPLEYQNLLNLKTIDVNSMLIHTALWTRPPLKTGFHLSDCWAWLRYISAFSAKSSDLRLRKEWLDIDPHQKTILSDEIGVGSTTFTLIDTLGFQGFVDSIYLLKTLKLTHLIHNKSKRGLGKTPDYIGLDKHGKIVVLECKGTQNSVKDLYKAIQRGITQKESLTKNTIGYINMGLVGGIFIPQFNNKDNALIHFSDPKYDNFEEIISTVPSQEVVKAIIRGAIIKQLYLASANNAANELSNYTIDREFSLSQRACDEIKFLSEDTSIINYAIKNPLKGGVSHIEFKARIEQHIIDTIKIITQSTNDSLALTNNLLTDNGGYNRVVDYVAWKSIELENGGEISTGHGFNFSLNYKLEK